MRAVLAIMEGMFAAQSFEVWVVNVFLIQTWIADIDLIEQYGPGV